MKRSLLTASALSLGLLLAAPRAQAGLIGSQVAGNLNFNGGSVNFFDAANGFVPATGYLNSPPSAPMVTIGEPAIEFGYQDGANRDTANFTDTTLTFSDTPLNSQGQGSILVTFTDPAFAGLTLTKTSDSFTGGVTGTLSGSTITLTFAGGTVIGTPVAAEFTLSGFANPAIASPEPGTIAGAGFGLLAVVGAAFRRRRSA